MMMMGLPLGLVPTNMSLYIWRIWFVGRGVSVAPQCFMGGFIEWILTEKSRGRLSLWQIRAEQADTQTASWRWLNSWVLTACYGQKALERVCEGCSPALSAESIHVVGFTPSETRRSRIEKSFKESCWLLIISLCEMWPDFKTLGEVTLIFPVSSEAAEHRFSLQNKLKQLKEVVRLRQRIKTCLNPLSSHWPQCFSFLYCHCRKKFFHLLCVVLTWKLMHDWCL